jgi:elongin-A
LWKILIQRDFPQLCREKNYVPKNPKNWCNIYRKYRSEEKAKIEEDRQRLKAQIDALNKHHKEHVTKTIDPRRAPKLPRDPYMMPNNGGVPLSSRNIPKSNPSKLKWLGTSQSAVDKARREAREQARMREMNKVNGISLGRVMKAPQAMIDEHRRAAIKKPQVGIRAPGRQAERTRPVEVRTSMSGGISLEERERRLRAAKAAASAKKSEEEVTVKETIVVDDDDDGEDDIEALFNENVANQPISSPSMAKKIDIRYCDPDVYRPAPPKPSATRGQKVLAPIPVDSYPATTTKTSTSSAARIQGSSNSSNIPSGRTAAEGVQPPSPTYGSTSAPRRLPSPPKSRMPSSSQPRIIKRKATSDIFSRPVGAKRQRPA